MRTDTTIQFKETVIVVTGASRGLGLRMAAALVDRGVTVVCSARSEDALERAVAELADAPGEALAIPADVREEADVTALFDDVDAAYGGADVLINNAGVNDAGLSSGEKPPVHELPTWLWDTILDTNLRGAILSSRAALHGMLERDRGVLLHLSSSMGLKGRANRAAYATSKCGLEDFHQSLAAEFEGTGVDSGVLNPGGGVNTDGFSAHMSESARAKRLDPAVVVEPALSLAAGKGENGGRYVATEW